MNKKSTRGCLRSYRPAFTLVEVVASLMLLGSLLIGILVAHRKHVQQIRGAERRLAAIAAMDDLLAKWSVEGSWGATQSEGEFGGAKGLKWRWTIMPAAELRKLGASIGRLEAIDSSGELICQVELLTNDLLPGTK